MRLRVPTMFARLRKAQHGLAAVEFALAAPVMMAIFLAGTEVTNYAIVRMRISQIAVHVADNASRIGTNSLLSAPRISEAQIQDLFVGANAQSGNLSLSTRGRVLLSSFEPVANPNTTSKFKIRWQRCYGARTGYTSSYGVQGATNMDNMGPVGQKLTAPDDGAVMFVEVVYEYRPILSARFVPTTVIREIAAMTVRDDRYYAGNNEIGIYNDEGITVPPC